MKNRISSFKKLPIDPFGSTRLYLLTKGMFACSVASDLASTQYFLANAGWDCRRESNPAAEALFCFLGMYLGPINGFYFSAAIILVGETLFLFFAFFPALYRSIPKAWQHRARRANFVFVATLSSFFFLLALENWNIIVLSVILDYAPPHQLASFPQVVVMGTVTVSCFTILGFLFPLRIRKLQFHLL